jgi:hypothetical protein
MQVQGEDTDATRSSKVYHAMRVILKVEANIAPVLNPLHGPLDGYEK